MQSRSELSRDDVYDSVTIGFHWLTVFLVVSLFLLALFPGVIKGSIALHKTLGLLVMGLVVLRILWRLFLGRRSRAGHAEPLLLRLAAKGAHAALYALLLTVPMLGWLYHDAKGMDLHFLGMEMPMLMYYDREYAMWVFGWKQVVAYTLLGLIVVHAAVAIVYHAYWRKDGVLRSMLPRRFRDGAAA